MEAPAAATISGGSDCTPERPVDRSGFGRSDGAAVRADRKIIGWGTNNIDDEHDLAGLSEVVEDDRVIDPLDEIEDAESKVLLLDEVNQLSEQERLVIALYYYEEMTLKEIGETLGISESRVSQIHTKAVGRLRTRMGQGLMAA